MAPLRLPSHSTVEIVHPAAERIVSGTCEQHLEMEFTDPSGQFCTGLWACASGCWQVVYTEFEVCEMLEGRVRMTDHAGEIIEVEKGDKFVMQPGYRGTWEILQPAKKRFAIFQPLVATEFRR